MEKATFKNSDGKWVTVEVGDSVGFKCDIEQSAEVIAIEAHGYDDFKLTVKAPQDGFSGHYIGRANTAEIYASETWSD